LKQLTYQKRKLFALKWSSIIVTTINKRIFLHGVTVEVTKQQHFAFFVTIENKFLEVVNFGVVTFGGVLPFSVEIMSRYS
jgi:hypothetical protein